MAISLDSATAANVGRFLNETQLSEPSPQPVPENHQNHQNIQNTAQMNSAKSQQNFRFDFAATPQLDIHVHEASGEVSGEMSDDPDANNNKYKKMLRYVPNTDFDESDEDKAGANFSSTNGASVPNTFKHKSHPNARTKSQIGLTPVEETKEDHENHENHKAFQKDVREDFEDSPFSSVRMSTIKRHQNSDSLIHNLNNLNLSSQNTDNNHHTTPSWMPAGLEDKWEELPGKKAESGSSKNASIHKNVLPQPSLDFLNSNANTFVHNPQNSGARPATPLWKKMAKEYENHQGPPHDSPLKNIFQMDETHDTQTKPQQRKHSGYASMSTISTPVATRDSEIHLTQHQIHQLEDMLEKAKNEPDDYQIKGSPLKLFGGEYDTFTKAILSKFVDKVRSNANSIQREKAPTAAELPVPKLKIKNFTKSGDYTDQDFMKNANNIFAHLQKKGYQGENATDIPDNSLLQRSQFISRSHTTATSTPKAQKIKGDFKDPSDLYSYSTSSGGFGDHHHPNTTEGFNEYTEIEKTNLAKTRSNLTVSQDNDDHDSYTFDELSDFESRSTAQSSTIKSNKKPRNRRSDSPSPRSESVDREGSLPLFESSMSSVKQFMKDDSRYANHSAKQMSTTTEPDNDNIIKWKRPSQLRLLSDSTNKVNFHKDKDPRVKGTVKPGNFPGSYGDMVFDSSRNMWISNGKENDLGGSLDSIEDLVSDKSDAQTSFVKSKPSNLPQSEKRDKRQLEVSFQIPEENSHTEEHLPDVTSVSEFGNATFSQSNKELVSLITGSTDQIVWESITSIDLSNKNIDRVENLEQYLPAVKSIDLSKNKLRFVEGLPSALFELDVTKNNLSDMTSFHKFHDLQVVNASFNSFRSFSCLTKNVNLTKVNLMGNQIESLDGFPEIHGLTSMNLSRNNICGKVYLDKLHLPNLKELNLSENSISLVAGIESLENLRILNVNENRIGSFGCAGSHKRLKKLLCKFNDLKELNLECFPYLRILRIDGNSLVSVTGLKKLEYLHELSAKSQSSPGIVDILSRSAADIASIDFSGNPSIIQVLPNSSVDAFYNVNQLNLSAVGLSELPVDFSEKFFNVRELNLNFNKLVDLKGLANLRQLKKIQILSNNITKMEDILTGLQKSRRTLKVLDMRLNIINFEFYPYVFSPQELELAKENLSTAAESPIPIQALEDIESFTIHYNALNKSREEWQARDNEFFTQMRKDGKDRRLKERLDYETILIGFFLNMKELDGGVIPRERRTVLGREPQQ